jgi:hypothetical protein
MNRVRDGRDIRELPNSKQKCLNIDRNVRSISLFLRRKTYVRLMFLLKKTVRIYIKYFLYVDQEDFSSKLCVQTGSGAHSASCQMGTGDPFLGGKARLGRDADHSPHLVQRS